MPASPTPPLSRRDLLARAARAGALAPLAPALPLLQGAAPEAGAPPAPGPTRPEGASRPTAPAGRLSYLEGAQRAARFLRSARIATVHGTLWVNGPERPEGMQATPDLYSGNAGAVLFHLELARATGDEAHLREAWLGADALAASLPPRLQVDQGEAGLYSGFAGIGAVLERTARDTGSEEHREAARRCRDSIHAAAQARGAGVEWGETTDIVAGAAGTGLYLLERARLAGDPASRELALRAGLRLAELGIPEKGGKKWRMNPATPRLMPNFSHGTAGVVYFLATLYRETRRPEILAAALAGGAYLRAIAETGGADGADGEGCLLFHDEPDNPKLYYLGWCHGPAGTARTFYRLHQATGDAAWLGWAQRGAKSILASGIPEKPAPGFWNNVGQCCGSASVGELFLGLHGLGGDPAHLAFARRLADDLLARATPTPGDGLKWIHAEHRIRPEYAYAQTGYMQGAAGIGLFLLHLDALERKRPWTFALPDSPWLEA